MPCDDVTEYLRLTLDSAERIVDFALSKNTCGATVGAASLLPYVRRLSRDEVQSARLPDLLPGTGSLRPRDAFLLEKQLLAIQAALAAYGGQAPGNPNSLFAVERIASSDQQTEITGLLRVDLATERIRACSNCSRGSVPLVSFPDTAPG